MLILRAVQKIPLNNEENGYFLLLTDAIAAFIISSLCGNFCIFSRGNGYFEKGSRYNLCQQ